MSIKIEQLLPLLKKGWVAMDEDETWWWHERKPTKEEQEWLENNPNRMSYTSECVEQPRFRRCEELDR